jgi:hypothetical protein
MHVFIASAVTGGLSLAVGLVAGTIWGRALEQKAMAQVLREFRRVDAEAHAAVNRLYQALPFLKKYL